MSRQLLVRYCLGGGLLLLAVFSIYLLGRENTLSEIAACNTEPKELRFSCYRAAIEKYRYLSIAEIAHAVERQKVFTNDDYAVFGTSCHTFYHALGDAIASNADNDAPPADLLEQCPTSCTGGCVMGLYKRLAKERGYSDELLKEFLAICRDGEVPQCAHELGHILHDKYVSPVLEVLDRISLERYQLAPRASQASFSKPDLNRPFEDCKRLLPEKELPYCYTGIGHNLFLFAEFNPGGYKEQFEACKNVERENRDECAEFLAYRIGINNAAPKFLEESFKEGNAVCQDLTAYAGHLDVQRHCYLGLGGGIGLFIDSEFFFPAITEKTFASTKAEVLALAKLCEQSEDETSCFLGLMGTKFADLYHRLGIAYDKIENILLESKEILNVVG